MTCTLVALLLAGSGGVRDLPVTVQDDAQLLHRSPAQVRANMRQIAGLGADYVRLTASWSELAPAPRSETKPAGFDGADPRGYGREAFNKLDTAIGAARAEGLRVQLDVAFWAPRWATARASERNDRERYAPDPREFGAFAGALAKRYSSQVKLWTTWNEPNHPAFLQPQWRRVKGGWRPASPHVYRAMHNAAYTEIKRVWPGNEVLLGATSSTGSRVPGKGGVPPLRFVRELACVDAALQPLRVPECQGFEPLKGDGFSHHPYSFGLEPGSASADADDAPIGETAGLEALLDQLADQGRLPKALPLYFTEYGYETNPPDPFRGVSPEQQAEYLGWASFLAWRDPRVRMHAQFLLRDIDPRESGAAAGTKESFRDYQTGLHYPDGAPKPAVQAVRMPFWATASGPADRPVLLAFGQVRPGSRHLVRLERRDPATGVWVPFRTTGERSCGGEGAAEFFTDTAGGFLHAAAFPGAGRYRMSRRLDDGRWESSAEIDVSATPRAIRNHQYPDRICQVCGERP